MQAWERKASVVSAAFSGRNSHHVIFVLFVNVFQVFGRLFLHCCPSARRKEFIIQSKMPQEERVALKTRKISYMSSIQNIPAINVRVVTK